MNRNTLIAYMKLWTNEEAPPSLRFSIPVAILTTSRADSDILASYSLHANCYVTKPVDFEEFIRVVRGIEEFWLSIVKLPTQ